MKKSNRKTAIRKEHASVTVSATLLEPALLETLVEKLADRRYDVGYSFEKVQAGWKSIETSSIEAYVSGDLNQQEAGEDINLPFITCFLFTCTKSKGTNYSFKWASSLS